MPSLSGDHMNDPQTSIMDAFREKNLADFMCALEFLNGDINELIEGENGLSLFHKIILTPKSSDYIRMCIENDGDCYTKSSDGRYPLHIVVTSQCPQNLKQFLKTFDRSKINVKADGQNNALHLLVDSLNQSNLANVGECLMLLLSNGCNPNFSNDDDKTPFFMLLEKQRMLADAGYLVKFFIDNADIDVYTYQSDKFIEMFRAQNKTLQLPPQNIQNIDPKFMMSLAVQTRDVEFEAYFKAFKESCSNNMQSFEDECANFLEMATIKNSPNIIQLILENVAVDVNVRAKKATWKFPPTFIACRQGFHQILAIFLRQKKINFCFEVPKEFPLEKNTNTTMLHEVCLKFGDDRKKHADVNFMKCFELLINDPRCNINLVINSKDSYGCTPLHYATRYKNEEATMALMKKGAYICTSNNLGQMALNDLNKGTFEKFLDECLVDENKRIKKTHMYVYGYDEHELHIDYSFLIPPKDSKHCEILPLRRIAKNNELKKLVKHPVLFSFLYLKWSKLSLLFNINFFMFALFLLSFIAYIVLCQSISVDNRSSSPTYMFFYGISIVFVILLTFREILQCLFSVRHYFMSKMNWFEMGLILLSFFVLFGHFDEEIQRFLRGVTILFAATEFLFLAGTLPNLSISTHMVILRTVIMTFLKSIALYSILLLGFGLCFYTLFGDDQSLNDSNNNSTTATTTTQEAEHSNFFYHPGIALIKTLVMLTGEFDFESLNLNGSGNYAVFVIFVFVITIVLFNLLNALAVSDTQQIKSEGQLIDLIQRISVLNKYEKVISNGNSALSRYFQGTTNIFNWIPSGKIIVYPNDHNEIRTLKKGNKNVGDEEMQTLNNNNDGKDASKNDYEKIIIDSWMPFKRFRGVARMDLKIMKAVKHVLEDKKIRKQQEAEEAYRKEMDKKLLRNIISIKMQYLTKKNEQLPNDKNF